ncbi:MAG: Flp1 family type IVb pilin [Lutisporaceae bacterium]
MLTILRNFIKDEDGISTVEIVVIIAILVGLALLFKTSIVSFVKKIIGNFIDADINPSDIESQAPIAQ